MIRYVYGAREKLVIDFSAAWCGPCRYMEPVFKELAATFTDVAFAKIDVDELQVDYGRF